MSLPDWFQLIACGLVSVWCIWALIFRSKLPRVILVMLLVPLSTVAAIQGFNALSGDGYLMTQWLRDALSLVLILALAGSLMWAFRS